MSRLAALEQRTAAALRSTPARLAGLALGLATIGLLAARLARSASEDGRTLGAIGAGGILLALAGFAAFHLCAIASLRAIGGTPASRLWAAGQLAKYLPAPGAGLAGMVRASVLAGRGVGEAIALTARHTGVLLGGAAVAGAPAAGHVLAERSTFPAWPATVAMITIGLAAAFASVGRAASTRDRAIATALATAGWAALGLALGIGIAGDVGAPLAVAGAFPAAWIVGLLALPVPAGIGVREATLLVILEPIAGQGGALSFAVATRALHVVSDAALALAVFAARRRAGASTE